MKEDGCPFWLNLDYFNFLTGTTMTNRERVLAWLFGGLGRDGLMKLIQQQAHGRGAVDSGGHGNCHVAAGFASRAGQLTGQKNLCLAGGVALNCVANGRILREKIFDNLLGFNPAAGDAGGALGAGR